MEGDAGASRRLTPSDSDDSSFFEVTAEDSKESETETDQSSSEVMAEDSAESEIDTDQTDPEFTDEASLDEWTPNGPTADAGSTSGLGRGGLVGIAVALVLLAGALGTAGYLAFRLHSDNQLQARRDAAAVAAARDCVAATQAPDIAAMTASAQKMVDCGTGAFRSQAILYSSLLVEAYQTANAHVEVSDMRAAVERHNPDGSIAVLVPLRVKVTNSAVQNQEAGYRLRVTMVLDEGQYKIAKLDQVAT